VSTALADVQPGDWFVVDPSGGELDVGWWVELGESLIDHRKTRWGHAGVATRRRADGTLLVAEAGPSGAKERPWHWEEHAHLWSTGTWASGGSAMGLAAMKYTEAGPWGPHGVPYSFLDYGAIEAHALHLNVYGLKAYIASTLHQICSQLVDQSAQDAGKHLFTDKRWPGYVKPSDLGRVLEQAGVTP
jgi:hypothetical protein